MPPNILARHTGYLADGTPILREYVQPGCAVEPYPELLGLRHYAYDTDGTPIGMAALTCCDELSDCPRVEGVCLPMSPVIKLHVINLANCDSARERIVDMHYCYPGGIVYDRPAVPAKCLDIPDCSPAADLPDCPSCDVEGQGKWTGSLALRGGTVNFEICCTPDAPAQWTLLWRGCDSGCRFGIPPDCEDPLRVNFGNIPVPECCDCLTVNFPTSAEMNVFFVANCRATVLARHVGYTEGGTPIVAQATSCGFSQNRALGCLSQCDLVASVSGCACIAGDYPLPLTISGDNPRWEIVTFGACPEGTAGFAMTCEVLLDGDGKPTGYVRLFASLTCGVTGTGSATVDILATDVETLDVTFNITVTCPAPTVCGTCSWTWHDMSVMWDLTDSACTGDCVCADISGTPPGTDGQTMTRDCVSTAVPDCCCAGTVTVRVTR
jgi:hypothetical protein